MTVAELIEQLKRASPDALVIQVKDAECNDYSPLAVVEEGHYLAETAWSGSSIPDDWEGAVAAVFLIPTN